MKLTITKPEFKKIKKKAFIIDVLDNWEHQELKKYPITSIYSFFKIS